MKTIARLGGAALLLGRAVSGLAAQPRGTSSQPGACSASTFEHALPSYATVVSAVAVAEGETYGEGAADIAYPEDPTNLPELCAVTVNVTSSSSSSYRFGIFLPAQWNSRFLEVGNGGFAGGINWLDMGNGVRYGLAVVSTDTGHSSTSGDGTWALNRPEKRTDFGWRAIHGSCILGKAVTEAFYGEKIAYSYYAGASTGGRQGLKEAEISSDSFDGVLVGAPAWWTSHLQPWTTKIATYQLPETDPKNIDIPHMLALADEVTKQCDALDGVQDGIISYPDDCHLDFDALLCGRPGVNASTCLTAAQIDTARNIYSDYYAEGRFAFPGLEVGSEPQWPVLLGTPAPNPLGDQYMQDFLFNDPSWTWEQYNDSVIWTADRVDPGNCTADDYDLSAFRNRGGKIVMNHGMSDGLIATNSSVVFYERVAAAMTGGDTAALQSWFKFFLIPGMQHVGGTVVGAPWYVAGGDQAGMLGSDVYSVPGFEDPEHDSLMALMDWVEKGSDFNSIIATAYKNSTDPGAGVLRQRPLCPYPQRQVYNGEGDPDVPESWHCDLLGPPA